MLWFLRGLRRGVVTTRYPARLDPWTRVLATPPAFRSGLLTRSLADRLEAACPSGARWRVDDVLVLDVGACTACGRCAEVGGDAVTASGALLLASRDRESLRKHIPILGDRVDG
jgi:hypothetical protein